VFYRGEIAQAIVRKSTALGGTMTAQDLADYQGEWVEPAASTYHGLTILELPPPSQAWAAEEMLNILASCVSGWTGGRSLAELGPVDPLYWHLLVEAKKLAYADLYARNADPRFVRVAVDQLLSSEHAASLCRKVDPRHASASEPARLAALGVAGRAPATGDTIVLSTADREGNMVSWVNSNYAEFGSGITVPGYGFLLHDRGALFSLDPQSPNVIAPRKRPFNTLSAGLLMQADRPLMTVTLMGGDMQAQGHAQLLVNVLDLGANLQAATELARFRHAQIPNVLSLESQLFDRVGSQLQAMGHRVERVDGEGMGGAQVIAAFGEAYRAGSDSRKDGAAVGW
jgi:gamma-glutamyltranspeptidase/glutathione hydrolase